MAKPSSREYYHFPISVPNLSNWSVSKVLRALSEHEQGNFRTSAFLWDALDRNPRINAAVNRRILTVQGLPSKLEAGEGDGRRNESALAKLKPHWRHIAPRKMTNKLLRGGIGMGLTFGQLVWRNVKGQWIPRIKLWHASFFIWDMAKFCYVAQTTEGLVDVRPGEDNWVIFSYDEWDDMPWMRGVLRCVGLPDSVRSGAVRDWARFSEVHGIPIRMLEIPIDETDVAEKNQVIEQIENPGGEMTVIAPKGRSEEDSYRLSLIEAKDTAWENFFALKKGMDGDVALAITGTEMVNDSGVYNPKDNSQGVRQDYTEADGCAIGDFLDLQVSVPWAVFNLGPDHAESAPTYCIDTTPPLDKESAAKTVLTLGQGLTALNNELRKLKLEVDPKYIEKFNIPTRESSVAPDPAPGSQHPGLGK